MGEGLWLGWGVLDGEKERDEGEREVRDFFKDLTYIRFHTYWFSGFQQEIDMCHLFVT